MVERLNAAAAVCGVACSMWKASDADTTRKERAMMGFGGETTKRTSEWRGDLK